MMPTTGEFTLPVSARPYSARQTGVVLGAVLVSLVLAMAVEGLSTRAKARAKSAARPASAMYTSFHARLSHNGRFRAEVVKHSASGTGAAEHVWLVRVATRSGRRVAHARVAVHAVMPESGLRMASQPVARYMGRGTYEITGLHFDRSGWWNASLAITHRGQSDSLAFNLILP